MNWNRIAGILWRYMRSQTCGAQIGNGQTCKLPPVHPFNLRCHLHGGLSSGPKTEAGRARISEAQQQRWAQWRRERGLSPKTPEKIEKPAGSPGYGPQEIDEFLVPDPEGVHVEEDDVTWYRVVAEIWEHGNRRNRLARMHRITKNLKRGGWRCDWCGESVPRYRRADARFCRERCRKAAARLRRKRSALHY